MTTRRLIALSTTMLLLVPVAYSETKTSFVMTPSKVFLAEFPEQQIVLGADIDLLKLGREFLQATVVRQYEHAEDESLFYKIEREGASVVISDDENGRVTAISTDTPGVVFAYGGAVGGRLIDAVGQAAFCNTYREDSADYCYRDRDKKVIFEVRFDENCRLPDAQEGDMSIPTCAVVSGIAIFSE